MDTLQFLPIIIQLGIAGAFWWFLSGISGGKWRTPQEMEALRERVKRAEDQVDRLIPAMDKLTDAINDMLARGRDRPHDHDHPTGGR